MKESSSKRTSKTRIFYLDFIRAVAVLAIILTHYNALFLYSAPAMPEKCLLTYMPFNIYIGDWGVSLFFIISGAALMHTYSGRMDARTFYRKRIQAIYPMLWISYLCVLMYSELRYHTFNPENVPPHEAWKIIFSVIGFDRYLSFTKMFGFVGEWFLGCIILMYLLFPLLMMITDNQKRLFLSLPFIIGAYLFFIFRNPLPIMSSTIVFVRIPEFLFGMLYMKYAGENKVPATAVLLSVLILAASSLIAPIHINKFIRTTFVGIASFLLLVKVSTTVGKSPVIRNLCRILSEYSYAIFLIHHTVIREIGRSRNLAEISDVENVVLFVTCCTVIFVVSYFLYQVHKKVMTFFRTASAEKKALLKERA